MLFVYEEQLYFYALCVYAGCPCSYRFDIVIIVDIIVVIWL